MKQDTRARRKPTRDMWKKENVGAQPNAPVLDACLEAGVLRNTLSVRRGSGVQLYTISDRGKHTYCAGSRGSSEVVDRPALSCCKARAAAAIVGSGVWRPGRVSFSPEVADGASSMGDGRCG